MKRIFLFMLFLIWGYVLWGQSLMDTIFGPSNANDRQMILINQSFNKNDELNINLINLSDLAISGDIRFTEGRFGFVRLILEDESEREYLLLEENKWFSKEPIFHFENRCMETKMLDNVHALRIKVICKNAQVTIKNLSYTTSIPYDAKLDMRYQRLQIQAICNKWNEYNKETGQLWYAHVDENIHLSYKDIKQKHGDRDDFIPDGMDFYAGGIFVIWDFDNDSISPFTKETIKKAPLAASTSPFIEHFDWRNRHGRSWVTNVKNQKEPVMPNSLGNGGCWAFSVCATVESAYRLYFNRRDNIDLSEQELGSCTSGSLSIQGGLPTDALEYIKNSGIATETCFPFQNNCTIPCSDKCLNPLEVITINNYSSVFKNQDSIKSALIHYGPISSGLITRYCSHCMELVGYNSIHAGDVLTFYKPNDTTPAVANVNNNVIVTLKNYGAQTINSVRIYYSVDNGVHQYFDWSGTLLGGGTANVTINTTQTYTAGYHEMIAWVDDSVLAAGVRYRDHEPFNDTLWTRFIACDGPMHGTRVVGGSTPDYQSLEKLLYALSQCGVDGPLTVKLAPGYYLPHTFPAIPGISSTNYVRFEPLSGAVTFVSSMHDTSLVNSLVNLQRTHHVRFKNIHFLSNAASNPVTYLVRMGTNSVGCQFDSCSFAEVQGGSMSESYMAASALLYSGGADSLVVNNCTFNRDNSRRCYYSKNCSTQMNSVFC